MQPAWISNVWYSLIPRCSKNQAMVNWVDLCSLLLKVCWRNQHELRNHHTYLCESHWNICMVLLYTLKYCVWPVDSSHKPSNSFNSPYAVPAQTIGHQIFTLRGYADISYIYRTVCRSGQSDSEKLTHLQPRPKRPEPPPLEDETPRLLCAEDQKLPVPMQVRKILKFGNPQAYVEC